MNSKWLQSQQDMIRVQAVSWRQDRLILLDQTALPKHERYLELESTESVISAIKRLVVRGAPAIGVAGAYGAVIAALEVQALPVPERKAQLKLKLKAIEMARPTGVNLSWAVGRLSKVCEAWTGPVDKALVELLISEATQIHQEDIDSNFKISNYGTELLTEGPVLTVCNTGGLATGGIGTAFGVLAKGFKTKKVSRVYALETRPLLQGIRLTAWELNQHQIPYTIICDSMAASIMAREKISAVITGADRIAANGDVANKIGTYGLALLAKAHGIPFYVAAPVSTFDLNLKTGHAIPIEERQDEEILSVLGENRPEFEIPVWNPAFDLTPHELISAIICERGVINTPNQETIRDTLHRETV